MVTADWSKKTSEVPVSARRQWRADRALRPPMRSPGRPEPSRAVQRQFWRLIATGITSAEAALGRLREADITLDGLKGPVDRLPAEGRTALKGQLGSALPTLRATSDRLLADVAIGPVIRPVIADVMTKLNGYAG